MGDITNARNGTGARRRGPDLAMGAPMALAMALACIALACALASALPARAWASPADEAPDDVPRTATGTCYIGETWLEGESSFFTVPSFTGLLEGAWPSSSFTCLNHTAAAPEDVDADYEALLTGFDAEAGWVEYYVTITPPDATDGETSNEWGLIGYQRVGGTVRLAWTFEREPQSNPVSIWARKADAATANGAAQGSATLAGARFAICYYDDLYDESTLPDEPTRTWTVETDANGVAFADDEHKVAGDEYYRLADGSVAIPVGTLTVREVQAPEGYLLSDGAVRVMRIEPDEDVEVLDVYEAPVFADDVKRGGIAIGKIDLQNGAYAAQGAATLAGAVFCIVAAGDHPVIVDGMTYEVGDTVMSIKAVACEDGRFIARTAADSLPYGTYTIYESENPQGYVDGGTQPWSCSFDVAADGVVVDLTDPGSAAANRVIRGDFALTKLDGDTGAHLGSVPFLVTSLTTGERHVVVTDSNGRLSTSASWNAHTTRTNANDEALIETEDGITVDGSLLDADAGVWFGGRVDAPCPADDAFGALPFDTYSVTELRAPGNEGYDLAAFELTVTRDGVELDQGTIDDHAVPVEEEPSKPDQPAESGKAPKTGDALLSMLAVLVPATLIGLVGVVLSVRGTRRKAAVDISRGERRR